MPGEKSPGVTGQMLMKELMRGAHRGAGWPVASRLAARLLHHEAKQPALRSALAGGRPAFGAVQGRLVVGIAA